MTGASASKSRQPWKDASFGGSRNKDSDGDTQGSQEQIMGIKKTVDVHVVRGMGSTHEEDQRGKGVEVGRDQFGDAL